MVWGDQRGAAHADYDGDGRLDLVVSQNGAATKLFHNRGATPGLRVRLQGPPGNPDGIGAIVRLVYGERLGPARVVQAGSGYWSENGAVQVMGKDGQPTAVLVRWPGGRESRTPVITRTSAGALRASSAKRKEQRAKRKVDQGAAGVSSSISGTLRHQTENRKAQFASINAACAIPNRIAYPSPFRLVTVHRSILGFRLGFLEPADQHPPHFPSFGDDRLQLGCVQSSHLEAGQAGPQSPPPNPARSSSAAVAVGMPERVALRDVELNRQR